MLCYCDLFANLRISINVEQFLVRFYSRSILIKLIKWWLKRINNFLQIDQPGNKQIVVNVIRMPLTREARPRRLHKVTHQFYLVDQPERQEWQQHF